MIVVRAHRYSPAASLAALLTLLLVLPGCPLSPEGTDDDPIGLDVARAIFPATEIGQDLMEIEF